MGLFSAAKKVGTGLLDMDKPSRMARAKEQGFDTDTVYYHGASRGGYNRTSDIEAFDPEKIGDKWGQDREGFFFTTNKNEAGYYATTDSIGNNVSGGTIYPIYHRSENPFIIDSKNDVDLAGEGGVPYWDNNHIELIKAAKKGGHDSIRLIDRGSYENQLEEMLVLFDPSKIRSVNAAFDPAKASSSNLLASNPIATAAAGAGGLLAMTSSEDADAGVVGKSLDNIIKAANKQGVKLDVFENKKKGSLELSRIVVPEKSKGVGTSIMNDLAEYADKTGQTVSLSPSTDFGGTSKRRLTEFYKRFGFVQNKGKNKDYTISNSMYRSPSIKSSNPVATTSAGLLANGGQPSNLLSYMQGNTDAYLTNEERQYLQNKQAFESNFSNDTGWDRADILPFRVNEQTGEVEFATPEMIKGLLSGFYDIGQSKNTGIINPASLLELI
jgi:hypothetical protein